MKLAKDPRNHLKIKYLTNVMVFFSPLKLGGGIVKIAHVVVYFKLNCLTR